MLVRWLLVFIKENSSRTSIPPLLEMINYSPQPEVCLVGTLSDRTERRE